MTLYFLVPTLHDHLAQPALNVYVCELIITWWMRHLDVQSLNCRVKQLHQFIAFKYDFHVTIFCCCCSGHIRINFAYYEHVSAVPMFL